MSLRLGVTTRRGAVEGLRDQAPDPLPTVRVDLQRRCLRTRGGGTPGWEGRARRGSRRTQLSSSLSLPRASGRCTDGSATGPVTVPDLDARMAEHCAVGDVTQTTTQCSGKHSVRLLRLRGRGALQCECLGAVAENHDLRAASAREPGGVERAVGGEGGAPELREGGRVPAAGKRPRACVGPTRRSRRRALVPRRRDSVPSSSLPHSSSPQDVCPPRVPAR